MTSATSQRLFAETVMPHLDDAYGLARWLVGDSSDAEDVVQDACIRAMSALDRTRVHNARPWLLTIVRNTALTWLARNRSGRVVMVDDLEDVAGADPGPTPEASLVARADSERLSNAIAALPLPFREALVMREYNDMSYREIAHATDTPIGTVMSRLARARAMLMSALAEQES